MKPLDTITVVELSTMITASLAAMMMAEQGAKVTKVEPIEQGDPMRYLGTAKGGMSGLFANCNRGKRSIRINLKNPDPGIEKGNVIIGHTHKIFRILDCCHLAIGVDGG